MTVLIDRQVERYVLAHCGLRGLLAGKTSRDEMNPVDIGFLAPAQLIAEARAEIPVIVPAVDEVQAQFVMQLRERMCLMPILAIVDDLSGHQTYRAMMSGATSVLNLELPDCKQNSVLRALFESCQQATIAAPRLHRVTEPPSDRAEEPKPPENLDLLVKLLCSPTTIAAISRRFYCSERSMYRRVRRLYDHFGVSSRAELRTLVVESS